MSLTHGNLAYERPNIDQQVVTHIYSRVGNSRVDDDTLAVRLCADESPGVAGLVLFRNERGDTALEEANTGAKQNQPQNE